METRNRPLKAQRRNWVRLTGKVGHSAAAHCGGKGRVQKAMHVLRQDACSEKS